MQISRRDFGALLVGATVASAQPGWAQSINRRSGFATPPERLDAELTRVEGRFPAGLSGVLYRAGPAQFERNGERLGHWFDGDGMIQRFAIGDGRVRHSGRFVDTPKRRAEAAAGRFLYAGYGFAPREPAPIGRPDDLNAANTNVLPLRDEVWALWEGGSPWRLGAGDLSTLGRRDFGGELGGAPFSAHPKQGPDGDIWNFGGFGARCVVWRLARDGVLLGAWPIALPGPTLMHDFAVTRRHIVLLAPPMRMADSESRTLIDRFQWTPHEPLRAIVLNKSDLSVARIYELPSRFLFHIGNAWEDRSGAIHLDAYTFDDAAFATHVARELPLGHDVASTNARATLITLRPGGSSNMTILSDFGEFPRVDPRRIGERHRFTYSVAENGIARWDWERQERRVSPYGEAYWAEEAVFVPRDANSGEADGWLIATRLDMRQERTELAVFDARAIHDGPLAVFACPYALPLGFHGAFAQSEA